MKSQNKTKKKTTDKSEDTLYKPGEKGFAVFLLSVGLFFVYESIKMYTISPGADSYAAVPLIVSTALVVICIVIIMLDIGKKTQNSNPKVSDRIKNAATYLISKDLGIIGVLMLIYSIMLFRKVGFIISTPLFLFISMSLLTKKDYFKNFQWTCISMVFILFIFSFLFKVVLP